MSIMKSSLVFAVAFVATVRDELIACCEQQTRISRKEFLDRWDEEDQAAVSACLDRELVGDEGSDREFDTMKGPGGGLGLKGSPRGNTEARSVTHVQVTEEFVQQVSEAADKILKHIPKGFNVTSMQVALGMVEDEDGASKVSAALAHLCAANKLEHKPAVGYRRPRPATKTA